MRKAIERSLAGATLAYLRRHGAARTLLMRAAARRGHALVLCYHRVAPIERADAAITPVAPDRFAEQMRALRSAGDIVPLGHLVSGAPGGDRPRFAVTFDDDDPCHVRYVLPILRDLGIPATFFLSGRALHGLGAYWWTLIERSVADVGLVETCRRVGRQASTLKELVHKCRMADAAPRLSPPDTASIMPPEEICALADAGMTIGFHTIHHAALPLLDDEQLGAALADGRQALADTAGSPIELFAYPYGRSDARTAAAVRKAGFGAAFTTRNGAMTCRTDPFLIGRWQPGSADATEFLAEAAVRLAVPSPLAAAPQKATPSSHPIRCPRAESAVGQVNPG
jgi:peptidoglycan/xylan/chitin deacetylase (PgdA/CDA1 family)